MNKKQWIALGFMFMIFAILASFTAPIYSMPAFTGNIGANIKEAMYTFLSLICFIAAVACWICAWYEKEVAR